MTFQSPSTPSEGEIVESDSEKATTSLRAIDNANVDSQSRIRASVSPSPSPHWSPRRHRSSRTPSRSPYRENRGSKRIRDDDLDFDRSRNESRRIRVRYEDRLPGIYKPSRNQYADLDRSQDPNPSLRYEDRKSVGRSRANKPQTQSRSPFRRESSISSNFTRRGNDMNFQEFKHTWDERDGQGYRESRKKLSREQSVSDRGQPSVAAVPIRRDTENRCNQAHNVFKPTINPSLSTDGDDAESINDLPQLGQPKNTLPFDESTLIEERRQRREAIKAKYRGQETPMLLQALALNNASVPIDGDLVFTSDQHHASNVPHNSPPLTPQNTVDQDSPTSFIVLDDADLANSSTDRTAQEDEPSAADYDPTLDMQEDQMRYNQHHLEDELLSAPHIKLADSRQATIVPNATSNISIDGEAENEYDMFAEGDEPDTFEEAATTSNQKALQGEALEPVSLPQAKALDMSMLDDWDDHEGYYKVILGELLDGRYHIQSNLGKGMFSGVVRAIDQKTTRLAAIKIIRNNETMKKAGYKEIEILQRLCLMDPEDKKHIIRLERFFEHKGHLCMVFENLSINLREVLKKFGRDVGINLKAVRAYAHQMFMGLSLLRKCNILHADLKPDNVLVNESRNLLKICDLGSASDASENEITPYLVSRFYRAPEIILGVPYSFGIDVWSVGCTLFELYTGKILFTGRSNNQMLRAIMECRGKFSHKILRRAQFAGLHFDDLLNFRSLMKDKLSDKDTIRILNFTKPTRDLKTRLLANAKGMNDADMKELNLFADLLDGCLNLNPEKRCTPAEALKHPFITRMKV